MTVQTISRQVAAIALTLVASATCVIGAVGPATANGAPASVVASVRA